MTVALNMHMLQTQTWIRFRWTVCSFRRKFQHTPGIQTIIHVYIFSGIRNHIGTLRYLGYVPGVCWNLLRSFSHLKSLRSESLGLQRWGCLWETLPPKKKNNAPSPIFAERKAKRDQLIFFWYKYSNLESGCLKHLTFNFVSWLCFGQTNPMFNG